MDEKDWQFYIDAMKRIIKRMLPNFGGDIINGMRLIEEERTHGKARIILLMNALREIKDTQGKVCENYEICLHVSCASSYSSWAIADKALSDKFNQSDKEECGNACGYVEPYGFVPESGCPIHCPEDKEK